MNHPCPNHIPCLPDNLINYSSEDVDIPDFPGIVYGADGCVGRCVSFISQEDADLCAQRQLALCENPPGAVLYPNDPQECSWGCANGATFTNTVPAGSFIAPTLDEANAQAKAYACASAPAKVFCPTNISRCCCTGLPFSQRIDIEGASAPMTFDIVAGALPTGIAKTDGDTFVDLAGTPTAPGNFSFTLRSTDAAGNFVDNTYVLSVIEVADASLPPFAIGLPYTHQMSAAGGSGNFAWRIAGGTLPPGLTMTTGGLISGVASGGATTSLNFEVIDLDCQQADASFFPPRVALVTASQTRVATVLGYPEFTNRSTPPRKYHKLTWSGKSVQWGNVLSTGEWAGTAKYVWSGTGEIDTHGVQISAYSKNFYVSCLKNGAPPQWPTYRANGNNSVNVGASLFIGYCWAADPNSCPTCADPPSFYRDQAINSTSDVSPFIHGAIATFADQTHYQVHTAGAQPTAQWRGAWDPSTGYAVNDSVSRNQFFYTAIAPSGAPAAAQDPETSPAYWQLQAGYSFPGSIEPVTNFPPSEFNGIPHWIRLSGTHWYEGLLEDEYTDAEALANAIVFNSGGNTAEYTPRTTGFTSRFTSVSFSLVCSNLVPGSSYAVSVIFTNTKTGARTAQNYSLLAAAATEVINDVIPTPAAGQPVSVSGPSIAFAP